MNTYRVAVSFPGLIVPGFVFAPAFDTWTRDYASYHGALTAAVQLADLYAGNAIVTIVEVGASIVDADCVECGAPLRVLSRADDDIFFLDQVCPPCRATPEPNY